MIDTGKGITNLDLHPYGAYRETGVDWLDDIPAHWAVVPLGKTTKRAVNGIWGNEPNGQDDIVCIRVADFDRHRWRISLNNLTLRAVSPRERRSRLLKRGDLLLERSGGGELHPVGITVLFNHDLEAVCSNFISKLSVSDAYEASWLTYLHSHLYALGLNKRSIKQTTGIQNLNANSYFAERIPLPPLAEQVAIARFLEYVDDRIWQLVEAKEKLVGLLEELRASTIAEAVTGRIDVRTGQPYPAYKPTGIEWLGSIPVHWELVPNKAMLRKRKDLVGDKHAEFRLLSLTKRGVIKRDVSTGRGKFSADMSTFQEVRQGDLVFCLFDVPETPRTVGLSRLEGMITGAYTIFECKNPLLASFLEAFYIAMDDRKLLSPLYSGLRNTIAPSSFLGIKTAVPPPGEQAAIVKYVRDAASKSTAAISNTRREIELLREYRTRMIADVVTGKLDVREAVDNLKETAA